MGIFLMIVGYGWVILGIIATFYVNYKTHGNSIAVIVLANFPLYFFPGLAIGALGSILSRMTTISTTTRDCPMCAEAVNMKALICKHCGNELPEITFEEKISKEGETALFNLMQKYCIGFRFFKICY